jgi:hypothetical protein
MKRWTIVALLDPVAEIGLAITAHGVHFITLNSKSAKLYSEMKTPLTLTFLSLQALHPALDFFADLFEMGGGLKRKCMN